MPSHSPVPARWVVRRALLFGLLTLVIGLGYRYLSTPRADLGPADLQRFESLSGIDLPSWYERQPFFLKWTRGDGQVYAVIAVDPLLEGPARRLREPDYRFSRAGYSYLARLVVGGEVDLVPIGLLVVNSVALFLYGALAGRLAPAYGRRALVLLANPALYIAIAGDTSEAVGLLLVTYALTTEQTRRAGFASAVAATVRPDLTTLLPAARNNGWRLTALALSVAATMRAIPIVLFDLPWSGAAGTITWPLLGYLDVVKEVDALSRVGLLFFLATGLASIAVGIRRLTPDRWAFLATGGLGVVVSASVLSAPVNYVRAGAGLVVLWVLRAGPAGVQTPGPEC